mgnify:CR=1 FL=1
MKKRFSLPAKTAAAVTLQSQFLFVEKLPATVLDVCIELETVNEFWKCFSVVAVGQFLLLFGT